MIDNMPQITENKRLQKRLTETEILIKVTRVATSTLELKEILNTITEIVADSFKKKVCSIYLVKAGGKICIETAKGHKEDALGKICFTVGEGVVGWVARELRPLAVENVRQEPRFKDIPVTKASGYLSMLAVPILRDNKLSGVITLQTRDPHVYSQNDINLLTIISHNISSALHNAELYRAEVEKEKKTLSLYWEVIQTKDYLKSIIDNSADAIIISDTDGLITSWNKSAEKIYGYTEDDVLGKFLPMVPPFEIEKEKTFIQKILQKEKIKNIETIRQTKEGKFIEVSLTLSPILDSEGKVTGISGISRDISEKKRVEKELIKKNQELSRLFFINSVVRSTLELDKLLRMVLTVVTMSDGLGFNRAILFLVDEARNTLNGTMGVGPSSMEEASQIWLSLEDKSLETIIKEIESRPLQKDSYLDRLSKDFSINLDEDCILSLCVKEKKIFNVPDAGTEPSANVPLNQKFGTRAYGLVPLITRDKAIGLILVDNLFTGKEITYEDLQFLIGFTSHIASAIENARLFEEVSLARAELKNIFESISDMVYFNDKDYIIRSVNQAVIDKCGKPAEEIIGKKCYEVFHNRQEPWSLCPHKKTIDTKKAHVEEISDPNLGSTFVVSSSPIFDSLGNLVGTVHISRDITELQALRERVSSSERMAALGEMAARVAHEIRNPLISVGGFARRLEKKLDGDLHEYAKIILEEVWRLENILKEILGFVKGSKIVKNNINLNEFIDDIINFISPEILDKGNRLSKELSDSPIMITVDTDRIKEAILNIITNANQATESGTINVKTRQEEKEALIEISDSGCGIKKEDLKHIFTPFFTTRAQGTGFGLTVTHRIIQEHKGRIDVQSIRSEQGKDYANNNVDKKRGTTFKIYLPLDES
ncbi:MAG: PAS domain S-box protein [Candidatus Mariimomonas ferrooxydans]